MSSPFALVLASITTTDPPAIAVQLLLILGTLLLLTTFAMVAVRTIPQAIQAYAWQSLVLALVAVVVGFFTGSSDLYIVAVLTVLVKWGE